MTHRQEGRYHMDFTRSGSAVKELWHASGAIDILCKSKIGFGFGLGLGLWLV